MSDPSTLCSPECEVALVRALMQHGNEAAEVISAEVTPAIDITMPRERAIINAFNREYLDSGAADPMMVAKRLAGHPALNGDSPELALLEYAGADAFESLSYLKGRIADIRDKTDRRKLLAISESIRDGAINCQSPDSTRRIAQADLEDLQRATAPARPRFVSISAAELAAGDYRHEFVIDNIMTKGEPSVGGGAKKTLKTSTAVDEALSAATGTPYLGKFPVSQKLRVLFCSGESGLPTLQETARRISLSKGYDLSEVDNFTLSADLPRLDSDDDMREFEKFIVDHGTELLILDPLYLMLNGDDAGNLFKQGARLRNAADMCKSIGVTLDLRHHTRSTVANPFAPADLDHLAWSGCAEFARQWQLISRREAYQPGSGIHRLWLSVGGSAGHGGLWALDINEGVHGDIGGRRWDVLIQRADEALEAAERRKADAKATLADQQQEADVRAICALLAKHPNGATRTYIRDHVQVSARRVPALLAAMHEAGQIVDCEVIVGNKKTPQPALKLNTEAA